MNITYETDANTREETKISHGCKNIAPNTKKCVGDFGDVTTLHGVRYITDPQAHFLERDNDNADLISGLFDRLCWIAAVLLSATFCGLEINKLWQRWQTSPVITAFDQNPTKVTSIPFPAVTICPENKIRLDAFDVESNFLTLFDQLNGTQPFANKEQQILAESISRLCQSTPDLPGRFSLETHHRQKMHEISPRLTDVFQSCKFNFLEYNCSDLFQPVITKEGICFTFNLLSSHELFSKAVILDEVNIGVENIFNSTWDHEFGYQEQNDVTNDNIAQQEYPRREIEYIGPDSGLQLVLKTNVDEVQHKCSSNNAENFRIVLHAATEFPSPLGNYLHVSPGTKILIPVRASTLNTQPELRYRGYSSHARGCNFPENQRLMFFSEYTKQNCMLDKLVTSIYSSCGCTIFYLPSKAGNTTVPICNKNFDCIETNEITGEAGIDLAATNAECLPSCFELKYDFRFSYSKLAKTSNVKSKKIKYTKLIIFFEEESFYGMKKSELYGITDFIASCGGLLGLFTGFSVISAIEIFYFISFRGICRAYHN